MSSKLLEAALTSTFAQSLLEVFSFSQQEVLKYSWFHFPLIQTLVSLVIVDKAGRRPLLMTSALIMSLSMTVLGLFLYFKTSTTTAWGWIPLVSIILSFIGYSVGFATIPFSIMGEMLPTR